MAHFMEHGDIKYTTFLWRRKYRTLSGNVVKHFTFLAPVLNITKRRTVTFIINLFQNATILCWIHSHVDRKPTHLSCTDLHYYYILQNVFPHIQALVVDVFENSFISHEFYNSTHNGKQCLSKCMKKPHAFDGSCIQNDF